MIYRLKTTLITLSLLCFATLTKAQISATFMATQANICEGIAVGFIPTINSTNPVASVFWDFGDGVFVNDPLPYGTGKIYNAVGVYTIRLVVNDNAGNTDTITVVDMITVNPNPEVSFTVLPTAGCQPLDVQFSPIISSPSTNGWTWIWTFSSDSICFAGDNRDTIIRSNPNAFTNTFQNDGIYDIKLVVKNQFNCQSDTAAFNVFTVEPKPTASFTTQVQVDCDETTTVNFASNSTLTCTGTPTYIWDFGDGSTIQNTTQPTITHEYQTSGIFTVQLITTDGTPNGCADTTTQTINISADPTVTIQAPNGGCTTDFLQFNGSSSGTVSSWIWDFGDGDTSNLQHPTHAYASAGCYTPSLTITVDTCSFTTQLDTCIVISSTPTATFTSLDDFLSCTVPHTMDFTSSVSGTATPIYNWNFGDETTSTNANPTKTWNYAGTYPVSLTVSTPQGCTATTLNDTIVIDSVVVNFTSDIVSGCEPIVVQFSDNSTAYTGVTGWLWRFGDGSTSTQQNPTHTYSSAGFYDVELVVTTAQGCSDSLTISNYITVGTPPALSFAVSDNTPCLEDSVSFINTSSSGTNWLWFNGIDTVSGFNIPDVSYSTPGVYNAWLSAENNGCVDTLFQSEIVYISSFEVNFGENGNCAVSPTTVDFFDNSTGSISSWYYDFGVAGMSNDTSNLQNPSYTYPAIGQYTATLTVTNTSGCSLTDSITIDLSLPVANFGWTTDSVACVSVDFAVAIVDSSDNNQGGCSWIIPDEATFLFGTSDLICEPIISFDSVGYYNLTQIVESSQGCFDTIVNEICVTDVTAVGGIDTLNGSGGLIGSPIVGGNNGCIIQINPTTGDTTYITAIGTTPINCNDPNLSIYTGCVPLTVEFSDSSFGFPDSIVSYIWDFGDGNTSNFQNPTHTYNVSSGELAYLVTLTVVNQYGVVNTDTLSTFIKPTEPVANFSISTDTVCTNLPITTVDSSSGFGLSYNWDFGDGNNSTVASPSFSYNVEGNYQVCLTVTDINGCDSTVCDSIVVIDPVANFSADTTYSACDNLTVAFSDSSENAISWFWSFGNGNMSMAQNPFTIYSGTGFYDLTLIVGGAGGCQDTLTQPNFIQVDGPDLLGMSVSPTDSCEDHQVAFNIQGTNIGIVTIEFGDGKDTTFSTFTSLALDTIIYYTYDTAGIYNPVLKIEDSLNCERVFNFNTITTTDPLASFALDTTLGCAPLTVTANANASEFANQYQWIAPGATISGQGTASPSFTFQNEGYYNEVTLVVIDVNNCTDTLSFTDTITVADVHVGFYPDNYTGCYPLTVEFTDTSSVFADTIVSWYWEFVNGDTDTLQNPIYVYDGAVNVNQRAKLTVTSGYGCVSSMSKAILPTFPTAAFTADTFVCTGQSISFINQSTGLGLSYLWNSTDGGTTTVKNPTYSYAVEDTFQVTLTVTDVNGCVDIDTLEQLIVANPVASFTSDKALVACPPDSVQFTDSSLNAVAWSWTIEGTNPNNQTIQNPAVSYTMPGVYDVELIVTSASGCQDTLQVDSMITVDGPFGTVDFATTAGCVDLSVDYEILLSNTTNVILDNGKSIEVFVNPGDTLLYNYIYTERGTYSPTVFIQDALGCQRILTNGSITVTDPEPIFTISPDTSCIPMTMMTTNSSLDVDDFEWLAPTLTIDNSNSFTPNFSTNSAGFHDVSLIITDVYGCEDTLTQTILASNVTAYASSNVTAGCLPLTVQFSDLSAYIPEGSISSWLWNFGDGSGVSTEQNPTYIYTTLGNFTPTLTVTNLYGCTSSFTLPSINVSYPNASFVPSLTYACTGQDILFDNQSSGQNVTYLWDFDNGQTSIQEDPTYAFPNEGTYNVCVTVTDDNGCDSTYCQTITIVNPAASFTSDVQYIACSSDSVQFTDASANAVSWLWTFGDGNSSTVQSPTHTYTATGFYDVQLIVTSASGCQDTLYQEAYIEVGGPVGNFTFAPNQGCADVTATFVGTLTANSVTQYHWNFGNGDSTTHTTTAAIDSFDYVYTTAGTYFPTLTLEDSTGCQFNISLDSIEVDTLQFDFVASDTLICETDTIVFTPTIYSSSPIDSVIWIFDGAIVSTSMDSIPAIPYDTVGDFDVSLTVFSNHCFKTITKTQYIKAAPIPESYFTTVTNPFCSEQTIGFNDASTIFSGSVVGWNWDFGDTNTSTLTNPTHVYADSGFYTVNLQVISDFGCADDTTMTIYINKTPEPTMTVAPTLCIGEVLTLTPSGGSTYEWYEGANLICDTCVSIDIAPAVTTDYTLVAISSAGCRDTITQTVNVLPFSVPPLVVSNDTTICKGDIIQLFASGGYDVTQYQWDQSSTGLSCYTHCTNPFASPEVTTTFYVTLTWDGGCSKTDSITVTVIDDAQPILGADRTICQGESVELGIAVGTNAVWSPSAGLSCMSCDNPVASPMQTTTYAVEVTTANGCTIHDTITINVQTPDMIDAGDDATICDGTTIQLNGVAVGNFAWISSSSLSDTTILNPIASPLVTTDYILTVQNDLCIQQDTVRIVVADKVDITVDDIEICEGETAEIDIIGYAETITLLPDSGIINADPLLIRPTETATYMVIGTVPSCEADTAIFTIIVNPTPDIGLLPQMTVFNGTTTPLPIDNPNTQYMYTWTPSDLLSCPDCYNPSFTSDSIFGEMMIYVDILTDEGCAFSDSILVILSESCGNNLVQLPTAFTPNDDGNNDIFRVRAVGVTDIEIFRVYNRWGEQLFETTNLNEGWDGTYKDEPVEQGVYMYYVQVICPLTGEVLTVKGDVFLHF